MYLSEMAISDKPEDLKTIGQAGLQDQLKPDNCETTPNISHPAPLPFELCQAIIDNLSDDLSALRACSLTCGAFLPASRRHLFHSVRLKDNEEALRFLVKICSTDSPTSPCTYVRKLTMFQEEGPWWMPQVRNETLPFLAMCLPNVTSLELYHFYWMLLANDAQVKILLGFQKVQHLMLQGFFQTSRQANKFISSFPLLTTLDLWDVEWEPDSGPLIPLPRGLKSIHLNSNESHFFNQLLRLESPPAVSALYFKRLDTTYRQAVGELLKTLGSHLEHLQLNEYYDALSTAVRANLINLAYNTNLRLIRLNLRWARVIYPSTLDWVPTLFSEITSHHMEDVHLSLPQSGVDLEVFLASLEHVFAQQHWSNLRRLEITAYKSTIPEASKSLGAYMPILDSRGVDLVTTRF